MSSPRIEIFLMDDENEEKMARHGISPRRCLQVLDNDHVIVRNRKARRGAYLVIGRDHGGLCIAIPVEATHNPSMWRPITAWPAKEHERRLLT